MNDLQNLLERLSNAHRVSGYEGNVRQIIEDEVKPYVDEIRTDKMGNLIATNAVARLWLSTRQRTAQPFAFMCMKMEKKSFEIFSCETNYNEANYV